MRRGELDAAGRDALLAEVTEDVAAHVLYDSFLQAQMLAQEVRGSATRMFAYEDLMAALEAEGLLHRDVEFLPSSEEMADRRRRGAGSSARSWPCCWPTPSAASRARCWGPRCPTTPTSRATCAPTSRRPSSSAWATCWPSIRCAASSWRRSSPTTSSTPWARPSSRGSSPSRGPSRPTSCARYRIARDVTGAEERWAAIERLAGVDRHAQWTLMEGVDDLVEATARWYLENAPRGRPGHGDRHRARGLRPAGGDPGELGSEACARTASARWPRASSRACPRTWRASLAYLPGMAHAPDVIAASQALGRSVEDVGRTFSLLEDRAGIAWIEEQLGELPVSTRMQRWALQALRDDLWRARRDLAQRALEESPGAPVPRSGRGVRRSAPRRACAASPVWRARWRGRGAPTSPASRLAVRQLRALAS